MRRRGEGDGQRGDHHDGIAHGRFDFGFHLGLVLDEVKEAVEHLRKRSAGLTGFDHATKKRGEDLGVLARCP